ncbi:MAG: hypothetical protein ACRD2R_02715 [Terriglobales bacterium]
MKKLLTGILGAALLVGGFPLQAEAAKKKSAGSSSKSVEVRKYRTKKGKTVKAHKRRPPRRR